VDANYDGQPELPGEVSGLQVARASGATVSWNAEAYSTTYDVASGAISSLPVSGTTAAACLADDVTGTSSTGTPAGGVRFNQGNLYIGGTLPMPITGLSLGVAYDYTHGQSFEADYANATAVYLMYATGKWKFNNRFDYATSSPGLFDGVDSGDTDRVFAYTLTVDYSLWKNVISRVEFRWDHSLTGDQPYGGTLGPNNPDALPPNPSDKNATSLALNIIYQF